MTNFFYQGIFQVTKIIFPIITVPIVSNALGPVNIGIYNYSQSIIQYFILLAGLGMSLYGQRSIAQVRDSKYEMSRIFWELETLSAVTTILTLLVYLIMLIYVDNRIVFLVQLLVILAVIFDISWFFIGIEDFQLTSIRSMFVNILTLIFIVYFVKGRDDLLIYVSIQSLGIFLSAIIMWPFLKKRIIWIKPNYKGMYEHFKQLLYFLVPVAAITINSNINKTMLGLLSTTKNVAFFSSAYTVVLISISVIGTLDTVLLPRLSNLQVTNRKSEIVKIVTKSIDLQLFFTIPIVFGIFVISNQLIPWFFGNDYFPVSNYLKVLSILIIVNPLGTSIARQFLIPTNDLKSYNYSVIIGSIFGISLNIILIPYIGIYGALFSILISEIIISLIRIKNFIRITSVSIIKMNVLYYFISSFFMAIITYGLTKGGPATPLNTILQIIIASVLYLSITTMLKINPIIKLFQMDK